jgi:sugar/nucleoside kinase (ribokinase family)
MAARGRRQSMAGHRRSAVHLAVIALLAAAAAAAAAQRAPAAGAAAPRGGGAAAAPPPLLVVGSINADTTVELARLPARGECITSLKPTPALAVGGKARPARGRAAAGRHRARSPVRPRRLIAVPRQLIAAGRPCTPHPHPNPHTRALQGANQAAAAARLQAPGAPRARFVGRFGGDGPGAWMRGELEKEGLDLGGSLTVKGVASGTGIVWLDAGGAATSVVLGGANQLGWGLPDGGGGGDSSGDDGGEALAAAAREALGDAAARPGMLLLQREVPEAVNVAFARAAADAGVPILLDAGGEDAPLGPPLIGLADYVAPNELELRRLTGRPAGTRAQAAAAARALLAAGARRALVTLGERGALLLGPAGGGGGGGDGGGGGGGGEVEELWQPALPIPGGALVDATAAGDAFRAAFAVAVAEGAPPRRALRFAAAAGALAAGRHGAMPSLPRREEVEALLAAHPEGPDDSAAWGEAAGGGGESDSTGTAVWQPPPPSGGGEPSCHAADGTCGAAGGGDGSSGASGSGGPSGGAFPLRFASRLNSMRARRDLVEGTAGPAGRDDVIGWVARQGRVRGLGLVYFNHPQHTEGRTPEEVRRAGGREGWAGQGGGLSGLWAGTRMASSSTH